MRNKFPNLYFLMGELDDTPRPEWFEEKTYTLVDFKTDMSLMTLQDLFFFIKKISLEGRLNYSIITYTLGKFHDLPNNVLISNMLNNENIVHLSMSYSAINDYRQIETMNFLFNDYIYIKNCSNSLNSPLQRIFSKKISPKLFVSCVIPVIKANANGIYTNQLSITYTQVDSDMTFALKEPTMGVV